MCAPAEQNYAAEERIDDQGIGDEDRLLRYCRTPIQVVPCPINGQRLSSQAFRPGKVEKNVSVDLECLMHQDGLPTDARYGAMPNTFALAAISARNAREHANGVAWTPKPEHPGAVGAAESANKYHGEVIGPLSKRSYQNLAEQVSLIRDDL